MTPDTSIHPAINLSIIQRDRAPQKNLFLFVRSVVHRNVIQWLIHLFDTIFFLILHSNTLDFPLRGRGSVRRVWESSSFNALNTMHHPLARILKVEETLTPKSNTFCHSFSSAPAVCREKAHHIRYYAQAHSCTPTPQRLREQNRFFCCCCQRSMSVIDSLTSCVSHICLYSINLSRLSTYQASATTQEAKQSVKQYPLQDQELL